MRETTYTFGAFGTVKLTMTSCVGAGSFWEWVSPHQERGPSNRQPLTFLSR